MQAGRDAGRGDERGEIPGLNAQRRAGPFPQHPAAIGRHGETFGPHHHPAKLLLDSLLRRVGTLPAAIGEVVEGAAELGQVGRELLHLVVHEEAGGAYEVPIVLLLGFVGQRVHLVGGGGEQQDPHFRVGEELPCQLAGGVGAVEQIPEPLEFVEDHEIGFERVQTSTGEDLAQLADQGCSVVAILVGSVATRIAEPDRQVGKSISEPRPAHPVGLPVSFVECLGKPVYQLSIELAGPDLVDVPLEGVELAHPSLEDPVSTAGGDRLGSPCLP